MRIQSPSPNWNFRGGYEPELLVIHCTDGYFPSDLAYLRNPKPGGSVGPVSAHFLIAPNGDVHQLVDTANAAWHAGRVLNPTATLKPNVNPNLYSIGIEVSMRAVGFMTNEQNLSLRKLVTELCAEFSIPMDRKHIIGHREIYAAKTCPGTIDVGILVASLEPSPQSLTDALEALVEAVSKLPRDQQPAFLKALEGILTSLRGLIKS